MTGNQLMNGTARALDSTMNRRNKRTGPIVDGWVDLNTLVHVMKQAVYTLNEHGDVVEDSPSWREFTGQTIEGYLGMAWLKAIHPEDRDRFLVTWKGIIEKKEEDAFEYRLWHHSGEWRWVLERACPYRDQFGAIVSWIGVIIDISRRKRAEELLAHTTEQAIQRAAEVDLIFQQSPIGLGMFDRDLRYVRVSDELCRMNGKPADFHIGKSVAEIYPEGSATLEPLYREVLRTGIGIDAIDVEDQVNTSNDGTATTRHFRGQVYPMRDAKLNIIGLGTIWQDTSEQKRAEATQKLLNMELIHRTKNLITVVQSVAARSLISDQTIDQARQSLLRRLEAISRAYTSLTETNWQGAPLDKIIIRECEEHQGAIAFGGPQLVLNASAAQMFALVIHELATNAAKHGSLSVPEGRVSIRWSIEDGEDGQRFQLRWREFNGPTVQAPKRHGFGHTLLRRMMHDGDAYIAKADFAADGLVYDLDVALEVLSAKAKDDGLFQPRELPVTQLAG